MLNSDKPDRHFTRRLLLGLVLIMAAATTVGSVRADGGVILFQRTSGSFAVTVFATETPVRVGPAELSVLIETNGDTDPILDARVFFEIENPAGARLTAEATHAQARNKLLYCSLVSIPKPGQWVLRVVVKHHGQRRVVAETLTVVPSQSKLTGYGKLVAFPPVIVILFLVNRWLRRDRFLPAA